MEKMQAYVQIWNRLYIRNSKNKSHLKLWAEKIKLAEQQKQCISDLFIEKSQRKLKQFTMFAKNHIFDLLSKRLARWKNKQLNIIYYKML